MTPVTESLVDAKDEARQAEGRTDLANALMRVLEHQRESERAAFRLGMWMISSVFAAAAAAAGIVIAVLK